MDRDKLELWLDKHNHKMEAVRTVIPIIVLILQIIILCSL